MFGRTEKTQETLLVNLKDAIDLAKNITKIAPDSDYKLVFKYLCQTLKTGEAIASEAKPSTGHASLKNVSQPPPAIIPPSQPASVRLRQQPLPPTSIQTQQTQSQAGIIVDFGKKSTLKKHPSKEKKHIFSKKKKHPFCKQKALLEQKKALSKHYFINKKQQESTYN